MGLYLYEKAFMSYRLHLLSQYSAIKNGYQLVSVFDFYISFVINHNLVHIYNKARYLNVIIRYLLSSLCALEQ